MRVFSFSHRKTRKLDTTDRPLVAAELEWQPVTPSAPVVPRTVSDEDKIRLPGHPAVRVPADCGPCPCGPFTDDPRVCYPDYHFDLTRATYEAATDGNQRIVHPWMTGNQLRQRKSVM
jgi:hypothetical protein